MSAPESVLHFSCVVRFRVPCLNHTTKRKFRQLAKRANRGIMGVPDRGGDGYGPIGSWRWNFNVCRDVDHKNIVGVDFWSSSVQKSTPTPAACDFTDHYGCQW